MTNQRQPDDRPQLGDSATGRDDREQLLDQVIANDQIRRLVSRYAVAVDSRDLDGLVGLFVADVRVGRNAVGRAALRVSFEQSLSAVGVTILQVGTHSTSSSTE